MEEFIYALEDLFLPERLLNDLQADCYYIGAYQRGYKWKSFGANDQVPLFLTDIYEAYQKKAGEYYLQYITIKNNDDQKNWLEVIDGQQRLTTISLLFYSFTRCFDYQNITENKVIYERYLGRAVFDEVLNFDGNQEPFASILNRKQDLYYIYQAKECIRRFLELLTGKDSLGFYEYCRQKVKIIINLEDEMTAAEEIFCNLNDNKVDLTNYYLIKGLLFTKSTRPQNQKKSFNEIQEQRNRIARNWDEMDNWLLDPAHNQLFFNNYSIINTKEKNIGINSLLNALKPMEVVEELSSDIVKAFHQSLKDTMMLNVKDDYLLFNIYNDHLTTQPKTEDQLGKIYQTSKRLRNWFANNELYNLIGYYTCTKGNLNEILDLGENRLRSKLYQHLKSRLELGKQIKEIGDLNYRDHREKLNEVFLALNVFTLKKNKDGICIDDGSRFDFEAYKSKKWSIEHIYPQNPDCSEEDYLEYYDWFSKREVDDDNRNIMLKIQLKEPLSAAELKSIAKKDIEEHHTLGNLALLESGDNSALQNYIFPKKRKILLNRISSGAFVPQHTINTISKLLNTVDATNGPLSFTTDLMEWAQQDIDANAQWITNTYNQLLNVADNENRPI